VADHIALSGANGFLGWHTRAALRERGVEARSVAAGDAFSLDEVATAMSGSLRYLHLAGVNRGSDEEVSDGNIRFARDAAEALARATRPPSVVVFADSTQSGNGTVYGDAKARAADILRTAAEGVGAEFLDVRLPNLYGEHGRPFYNSVTATFCHLLAHDGVPEIDHDRELELLHAQDAADLLTGTRPHEDMSGLLMIETVGGLLARLSEIAKTYGRGEIPDVSTPAGRNLFNTYRSYAFPERAPIRLTQHADARGSFFEIVRSRGGTGQSSFSTTEPGVSRGDHFHRRKIERFTVLAGSATIALRKLFTNEVFEFHVTGEEPAAIDMPTMWSHNITNTGSRPLYTSFWSNDIFDPDAPDTVAEPVRV
jgi:UDP-2-acetamido-2,6-beta-L-arabino-hexul-4-ose reductase